MPKDAELPIELGIALMQADIQSKQADTNYTNTLTRSEPGKALDVAFGAGAALATAVLALAIFVLSRLQ